MRRQKEEEKMYLPMSQHKATNLVCRVLIAMLLYSFYVEAALSPSLAPHSQHHSHPLIPAPFYGETTPTPDSQPHSHPLIPAPDTAAAPHHLVLPPTISPEPSAEPHHPHHHHHHHNNHHHQQHHQHNKYHSFPPTWAAPLPSPYLSPPFDFNSPPPHAYPDIHNPITESPVAAPSSYPFKSTSPPPPPRRYGPRIPLPP